MAALKASLSADLLSPTPLSSPISLDDSDADGGTCAILQAGWGSQSDVALSLFAEDKVLQAEEAFAELEQIMGAHPHRATCEPCTRYAAALSTQEKRERLRLVVERVTFLRGMLGSDDGWILQREEQGIRTMYRIDPGSPFVTMRAECTVDAPVLDILALFYEVRLCP